ncbi:MAG: chorismate-binding protein [Bacteriovoracaceae bacterium]
MNLPGNFSEKGAFLKDPSDGSLVFATGGQFDIVKTFRAEAREAFYLKDFYSDTYLRYSPETILRLTPEDQQKLLHKLPDGNPGFQSIGTEDRIYEEDFRDLMKSFSGSLRKVVMISRENFIPLMDSNILPHLVKKALSFGAGIPYGIWGKDFGVIGSTPEELFRLKEGILKTHALAGTSRVGQENELLNSQKDLLEHNLVIQDITEKLMPFSGKVESGNTYTSGFKDIIHLKTDIQAAVSDDVNIADMVSSLSPTAALGGYPKKESLRFLKETRYFKKYPERSFGSTLGIVSKTESSFIVMIRNIQWRKDTYFIESGGGIVPGSELSKELSEISWKRNVVKEHYL